MSTPQAIAAQLVSLLGEASVIADAGRMTGFITEPRHRYHTPALAVALPRSVAEVQAVARWANENRVPLIAQGGNTGLVGGQVPLSGTEVILSLSRLDRVRGIDVAAGHMTLEAGVILEEAHRAAEAEGAMFPLWLASQGSARIGGLLGANAGGVQVLAFGNARELTLGIEAVTADGRLLDALSPLRKDNTGYDLRNLLIGSEGTLGIITAATVKLFPRPRGYETALCNVASPAEALELFGLLRDRAGSRLTAFELMPRFGIDMLLRHGMLSRDPTASPSGWYVLAEINLLEGSPEGTLMSGLEAALERGVVTDAVLAESETDRIGMWASRELISEVQSREGASIKHDVSVPVASVPQMIAEGVAAVEKAIPGVRPCPFGHLGDGNIHFNLTQPVGADPKEFMALEQVANDAIYEVVLRLNGSVSAEHGIGQLKTGLLQQVKSPVALDMMRAIKQALDPNGILNPGKMLA